MKLHCKEIFEVGFYHHIKADCTITVDDEEPKPFSGAFDNQEEITSIFAMGCTTKEWNDIFDKRNYKRVIIKGTFTFTSSIYKNIHFHGNYDDGPYDFIIVAGNQEIEVHKSILTACSKVFAAMFESEYNWKEKEENKYEIKDFPYKIIDTAICYCYENIGIDDQLDEIILLYKFADKYDMKKLKDDLAESLPLTFNNLVEYSNSFFQNNFKELLEECYTYFHYCLSFKIPIKDFELLNIEVKNGFVMKMLSLATADKIPEPSDNFSFTDCNPRFL
uniref:BTB domain-containing protein n=1 Tax=Panagrolaimus sp. ES5 TaxID=591445 RepID=A0AC34F9X1_9BILA